MWDSTVRALYEIRKQLMSGLGHSALRQLVWEKQFWKGADEEKDQKLDFDDVERMCRRLNINPSRDDLKRRFKVRAVSVISSQLAYVKAQQADSQNRGYLDFADFRKFVKALKARPEIERLFKRLCIASASDNNTLRYPAFAHFMREDQQVRSSVVLRRHSETKFPAEYAQRGRTPATFCQVCSVSRRCPPRRVDDPASGLPEYSGLRLPLCCCYRRGSCCVAS